jgi:hypothetical protein
MKEELLHYVWRTKSFDILGLRGTHQEEIDIQHVGTWNHESGPDFLNARVRINGIIWAGHIEMHLKSGDWYKHNHEIDPLYENVVLHVVWEEDRPVYRNDGSLLTCLELNHRISNSIKANYKYLQISETWVPCEKILHKVAETKKMLWMERLLSERIEYRTDYFSQVMQRNNQDVEQSFYQLLARAFGMKLNQDAMEQLSCRIPLDLLSKYSDNLLLLEAIFFGMAGFLGNNINSEWHNVLMKEFEYMQIKHGLKPMPLVLWTFGKIRPPAFPTLRIAQFAALLQKHPRLFADFEACKNLNEMVELLDFDVSIFWKNNYHFQASSVNELHSMGLETKHLIIINTVLPFLFYYGMERGKEYLCEQAIQIFNQVPPEMNQIIKQWNRLGMPTENAAQTQALLHLKKFYCDKRACLSCAIGSELMYGDS